MERKGKSNQREIHELGWNDMIDFGKNKGLTVREVFDKSPGWISWSVSEQILFYSCDVIQELAQWETNQTDMPDAYDVWEVDEDNYGNLFQ